MKLSFKPRLAGNAAGTGSTAPAAARTPFDLAFLNPCSRPTAFSLLGEDPAPPATGEPAPRRAIPASFQQAAASAQLLGGAGRKVLETRCAPPARAVAGNVSRSSAPSVANASSAADESQFKAWRLQTARAEGIDAARVCSNAVMHAILQAMPQSLQSLQGVRGIGPDKARKYGDAILALCHGKTPVVSSVAAGELTTPVRKTVGDGSHMESQFKAWRKQTADVESVPAFCVCSNAVMNGILACMPQTLQALQGVHGMGPTKVQKYGDAILALCRGQTPMVSSVAAGEMSPNPLWVRTRVGVRVESDPALCA
jgi:hypothetical protein